MIPEKANALGLLLGDLLGQQNAVDVRQHTAPGNCHCAQQLGELLIVADCQLNVARHDAGLLVVASGVTRQLKDLSDQIVNVSLCSAAQPSPQVLLMNSDGWTKGGGLVCYGVEWEGKGARRAERKPTLRFEHYKDLEGRTTSRTKQDELGGGKVTSAARYSSTAAR